MSAPTPLTRRTAGRLLALAVSAGLLTACTASTAAPPPSGLSGEVATGGSSTLGPLTQSIAERFAVYNPTVKVAVDITSTGDGFAALCAGTLDVANASREIHPDELARCAAAGIPVTKIQVANDAISLVVNMDNGWATCLSVAELKQIWEPRAKGSVGSWRDVRGDFPATPLALYGPDATSGTLDSFTLAVTGAEKSIRDDYTASKDDHVTLSGVRDNRGGLGFLGHSYVADNLDIVKAIAVDSGKGCVTPSAQTVQDGSYTPLSRPLFLYVNNKRVGEKAQLRSFLEYYVQWARNVSADTNFVPVTESQRTEAKKQLEAAERG